MKITEYATIKTLNLLRAPKANLGYQYLIDAVRIITEDISRLGMTTALYRDIAAVNDSFYSRVERCIRHEVLAIYSNPDNDTVWEEIVGYPKGDKKITNKEFIASMYWYLKNAPESR